MRRAAPRRAAPTVAHADLMLIVTSCYDDLPSSRQAWGFATFSTLTTSDVPHALRHARAVPFCRGFYLTCIEALPYDTITISFWDGMRITRSRSSWCCEVLPIYNDGIVGHQVYRDTGWSTCIMAFRPCHAPPVPP